jgi:hypothetical protein
VTKKKGHRYSKVNVRNVPLEQTPPRKLLYLEIKLYESKQSFQAHGEIYTHATGKHKPSWQNAFRQSQSRLGKIHLPDN